jgi:hypothetical protein
VQAAAIADQLGLLRPGLAKQHRFRIAVETRRNIGEINGVRHHVEFAALLELVDKVSEPEPLDVGRRLGKFRLGLRPQLDNRRRHLRSTRRRVAPHSKQPVCSTIPEGNRPAQSAPAGCFVATRKCGPVWLTRGRAGSRQLSPPS